jgi:hypothetical protein
MSVKTLTQILGLVCLTLAMSGCGGVGSLIKANTGTNKTTGTDLSAETLRMTETVTANIEGSALNVFDALSASEEGLTGSLEALKGFFPASDTSQTVAVEPAVATSLKTLLRILPSRKRAFMKMERPEGLGSELRSILKKLTIEGKKSGNTIQYESSADTFCSAIQQDESTNCRKVIQSFSLSYTANADGGGTLTPAVNGNRFFSVQFSASGDQLIVSIEFSELNALFSSIDRNCAAAGIESCENLASNVPSSGSIKLTSLHQAPGAFTLQLEAPTGFEHDKIKVGDQSMVAIRTDRSQMETGLEAKLNDTTIPLFGEKETYSARTGRLGLNLSFNEVTRLIRVGQFQASELSVSTTQEPAGEILRFSTGEDPADFNLRVAAGKGGFELNLDSELHLQLNNISIGEDLSARGEYSLDIKPSRISFLAIDTATALSSFQDIGKMSQENSEIGAFPFRENLGMLERFEPKSGMFETLSDPLFYQLDASIAGLNLRLPASIIRLPGPLSTTELPDTGGATIAVDEAASHVFAIDNFELNGRFGSFSSNFSADIDHLVLQKANWNRTAPGGAGPENILSLTSIDMSGNNTDTPTAIEILSLIQLKDPSDPSQGLRETGTILNGRSMRISARSGDWSVFREVFKDLPSYDFGEILFSSTDQGLLQETVLGDGTTQLVRNSLLPGGISIKNSGNDNKIGDAFPILCGISYCTPKTIVK